jgi:serine phosphatase RsbU (regulator of sigma subunit)/anti-sigma regulatory factor (Ser/Thr protein kinase)
MADLMAGPTFASSRPVTFRFSFPCDLAEVRGAVLKILDFLAEQGWGREDSMSFGLALTEACNNAVEHAADTGRRRPLLLEAVSDPEQIEFRVHDHTPGFEWPKKVELPKSDSESGRGLYLITSLTDYAGYFRGPDENLLVLRKARPAARTQPPTSSHPLPIGWGEGRGEGIPTENNRIISDLVEELSSCYESLSAIFRYSAEMGKTGRLQEFARRLFDDLLHIIGAEWFVLRLAAKDGSRLEVFVASEQALELPPLEIPGSASLETEAAVTRQTVWFDTAKNPPPNDLLVKLKPGSAGMVQPILLGDQFIGTVALGRRLPPNPSTVRDGQVFTAAQTNVVNTFADFLAIQIANARFQEEQLHQRLVTHELEIARNIQRSLLPAALPQLPGFSLAAFCRSAQEVGGDFYDAIKINDHSLLLVIADVMGKGIPAAMFAAILRTVLRAAPELTQQPSALLTRVNALLYPDLSGVDMFITAQLAFIDATARKIITASAGHCPLAVAGAGVVKTFSPEGMPLGIKADTVFEDATADLPENGRVLLYSDGVTDALDPNGKPFSQPRLLDWLAQTTAARHTAEQLKQELVAELDRHQSVTALRDDQTFLILAANP